MDRNKKAPVSSAGPGRRYRRFNLAFPVRLKVTSGLTGSDIEAVSKNVSLGGLLVRSALPIPQNTTVTFVMSVHGERSLRPVHLAGECEVVRVEAGEAEASYSLALRCNSPVVQLKEFLPRSGLRIVD